MNWRMLWDAILDREPEFPVQRHVGSTVDNIPPCTPHRTAGTQRQTVTVTQSHIDNGQTFNSEGCMVHRALMDVGIRAKVSTRYIFADNSEDIVLPRGIADKIDRFDHGKEVQPFRFEIVRRGNRLLSVSEAFTVDYSTINKTTIEVSEDGVHWFTVNQDEVIR